MPEKKYPQYPTLEGYGYVSHVCPYCHSSLLLEGKAQTVLVHDGYEWPDLLCHGPNTLVVSERLAQSFASHGFTGYKESVIQVIVGVRCKIRLLPPPSLSSIID
jgi:hypothetical protein